MTPSPVASSCNPFTAAVDVAKDKLDLAVSDTDRVSTCGNAAADHQRIVELLLQRQCTLVVVEATGGLEWPLVQALLEAGLNVARVNPGNVRHFAIGLGILAKTDSIDARMLLRFGQLAQPRLLEKASQNQAELAALVACRRQLQQTLTQQTNRLDATFSTTARQALGKVIDALQKQIERLDADIRKLIDSDDQFKDLDRRLRTVPGIGPVASATLLSQMPELGKTDRRSAQALLGVAPYNHDSGKLKGTRSIRGGRVQLRCVTYMATLAAMRCNPVIRAFAQRLRAKGKKAKVVIVACMRKLITLINAMIRDGLDWPQLDAVKNVSVTH
jgi:transposase